jgi:ppGpp synthetase/RelA/SpoT-type nucleotidyltranferase
MLNIDFMPFDETIIKQAVERYKRESDRYSKLAQHVADECRSLIQDKVIRGTVQWRVKDPDRFASKLRLKYMRIFLRA